MSGRIDPATENVSEATPSAPALAPSNGELVVTEKEVAPPPEIDAVSNGVFALTAMLADPVPDEISCPAASRTEMAIVTDPVLSGDASFVGNITGAFVPITSDAVPAIG